MGTTTTTFALNKPTVGGDDSAWGSALNTNADKIDDLLDGTTAIKPNLDLGLWKVGGVAVTSTASELNILDGVTATAAEINVLDGVPGTLTATELGYVDGVTSAIQTQLDNRVTANADDFLGAGYTAFITNDGTKSSGTYTPAAAASNFKVITNAGAFTFAGPTTIDTSTAVTLVVYINNASGAGAITMSGFSRVTGDAFTTTLNHVFLVYITMLGGAKLANVVALQ
jgi:hypothetical protein